MSLNGAVENKKVVNLIEIGKKFAVLVGINEYVDSSINRLNFSVKDIQDFYDILIDPEKGKYRENNVMVLSDKNKEKSTRNNILSKLMTMSRSANPEDSILFYFSGHGAEIEGKPYFLCSDSYRNTIEQTALPNELIRETMESSLARVKIIILDACHSGVLKGIKESGIMTKSFFESLFPPPEGFVALTSCKLGECSHEWAEKEHGVFSYYLLEGLEGSADRDGDKVITITDAHNYTSENVKRWAFKKGVEQNPTLFATISGDIPLAYVGKISEKEELIDKSVVTRIIIRTAMKRSSIAPTSERICGSLLQFVEPSEIEDISDGYRFPHGRVYSRTSELGDEWMRWVETVFEYKKENWDKIDEIINHFDRKYEWNSITYQLSKKMNIGKLVQKLKENAFEIISFMPEKGKELIRVNTEAWMNTKTDFQNIKDGSRISISRPSRYGFGDNFYSTLSPENIIEFIKNCLE